jgi:hypothetical protein
MALRPRDTPPAAWSRHNAVLEQMGGSGRLLAALELSDAIRTARLEGLKARHPSDDHATLIRRLVREDYGIELPDRR